MENKKSNNLAKKIATIFGAALAALSVGSSIDSKPLPTVENNANNTTTFTKQVGQQKPMPVLKLNVANPELSKFVTQHSSHSSHSSHASHASHSSHSSGAMFA